MKVTHFSVVTFVVSLFLLTSCDNSNNVTSTNDQIEKSVRHYFSMGDSVDVSVEVTDTIFIEELTAMQGNVSKNFNLAQMDIDTLDYLIENWENEMFNIQDSGGSEADINRAKVMVQMYQLNQADTKIKQLNYKNSNRVFSDLERETIGNISGYEVATTYILKDEKNTLNLLFDANFKVVD
jgi:hypothetical protein